MGRFQDTSSANVGWLHELARAEVHPEAEKLLQLGRSFDPQQLVEESTIEFLTELRECFSEYARIFNVHSENGTKYSQIKVYTIAQSSADFMLFRNQIKLIFSNSAHGLIQISFAQHVRGNLSVDGQEQMVPAHNTSVNTPSQELLAQVGPFRDIFWTYRGEKITSEQVAKYYFADFARVTRDTRPSKGSNQLLLDQIKALLQEKGLDL